MEVFRTGLRTVLHLPTINQLLHRTAEREGFLGSYTVGNRILFRQGVEDQERGQIQSLRSLMWGRGWPWAGMNKLRADFEALNLSVDRRNGLLLFSKY